MLHKFLHNKHGMTMVEVMVVCGLFSVILLGTMAVFVGSLDCWQEGMSSSAADINAGIAVQKLVRAIEEGSSASETGGHFLTVNFPYYDSANGLYDRSVTGYTAIYYRSGKTGYETSGVRENLWKRVGTTRTLVMRGISDVVYDVDASRLITITLTGKAQEGSKKNTSETVVTKIRLRN